MVRYTLGEKGERLKWNFYFLCGFLIIALGSCLVCSRVIDWSALQRKELTKYFLQFEEKILLQDSPQHMKPEKLWSECNRQLRNRWMVGYFVFTDFEGRRQGRFCGRPAPEFWKSITEQSEAIIAGNPIDHKKIPRYRTTVEFKKLNCRLLIGDAALRREDGQRR